MQVCGLKGLPACLELTESPTRQVLVARLQHCQEPALSMGHGMRRSMVHTGALDDRQKLQEQINRRAQIWLGLHLYPCGTSLQGTSNKLVALQDTGRLSPKMAGVLLWVDQSASASGLGLSTAF